MFGTLQREIYKIECLVHQQEIYKVECLVQQRKYTGRTFGTTAGNIQNRMLGNAARNIQIECLVQQREIYKT